MDVMEMTAFRILMRTPEGVLSTTTNNVSVCDTTVTTYRIIARERDYDTVIKVYMTNSKEPGYKLIQSLPAGI